MKKISLASAVAALWLGTAAAAGGASIQLDGDAFRVVGWAAGVEPAEGWGFVFPVYAGEGDVQPLLGTYAVEDHVLTFHPRFPVTAGVHYHAIFKGAGGEPV